MGKRLRILAGPNGSGKSSVYESLKRNDGFHWGVFVNADEIEKQLREQRFLDITTFGVDEFLWDDFLVDYQSLVNSKGGKCGVDNLLYIDRKIIVIKPELVDSYLACCIAMYIRNKMLDSKKEITFTIETVMSHSSKLDFMREARKKGFRVYLYYVSTSSPDINVGRVAARVQRGGHSVDEQKIRSRYDKSLSNLRDAILLSDRAYIFDNSAFSHKWIAEYEGISGELRYKVDEIPQWVAQYI